MSNSKRVEFYEDDEGYLVPVRAKPEHWPSVTYNERDYPICPTCGTDVYFATQDATTLYWWCLFGHRHTTPNPHPWPLRQLSMF